MIKRERKEAEIPSPLSDFLNTLQMTTLNTLERFGWALWFVRRPLFQEKTPVVKHPQSGQTAVIEEDGTVNENHNLDIRP